MQEARPEEDVKKQKEVLEEGYLLSGDNEENLCMIKEVESMAEPAEEHRQDELDAAEWVQKAPEGKRMRTEEQQDCVLFQKDTTIWVGQGNQEATCKQDSMGVERGDSSLTGTPAVEQPETTFSRAVKMMISWVRALA
jgi:hypothetical protein